MLRGRSKKYQTSAERNRPIERFCDREGCESEGAYRAPKSRNPSDGYHHFCLDHVREYNKSWNFFAGMSDREVESFQRSVHWAHRPTWKMGERPGTRFDPDAFHDPFGLYDDEAPPAEPRPEPERRFTAEQRRAFNVLQLEPTDDLRAVKLRYKQLAKRFHPDANGGDRGHEDRLKHINEAYGVLSASLG